MLNIKERLENWFKIKFNIHQTLSKIFFREGPIWLCLIGQNVGFEQNGNKNFIRPVLVLKKLSQNTAIILPLTSKKKLLKSRKKISFHTKNTRIQQVTSPSKKRRRRRKLIRFEKSSTAICILLLFLFVLTGIVVWSTAV